MFVGVDASRQARQFGHCRGVVSTAHANGTASSRIAFSNRAPISRSISNSPLKPTCSTSSAVSGAQGAVRSVPDASDRAALGQGRIADRGISAILAQPDRCQPKPVRTDQQSGAGRLPRPDIRLAMSRAVAIETPRGWRIGKERQAFKIDSWSPWPWLATPRCRPKARSSFDRSYAWVDGQPIGSTPLTDEQRQAQAKQDSADWYQARLLRYLARHGGFRLRPAMGPHMSQRPHSETEQPDAGAFLVRDGTVCCRTRTRSFPSSNPNSVRRAVFRSAAHAARFRSAAHVRTRRWLVRVRRGCYPSRRA